ncbi:hypothetical protein EV182_001224 [Spiromyces aspiralis]|uniref:Uncharacterized protein n=1 Tax=Spiromyces aspiralis TaxID=68401 RepID=A0ACC1HNF1_9FUNG|nr:hypothetical protein EV182_001224 [Spiromyces aspiralis]
MREGLLAKHPNATIDIVPLDTSRMASVKAAAKVIREQYSRLDVLFCNAGAMLIDGLNVVGCVKGLLTRPLEFFSTSDALHQKVGVRSEDGLGMTFATNVFGHYCLIRELEPLLEATSGAARIVWTGSEASKLEFDPMDIQHIKGNRPYESSKYIVDQLSAYMDRTYSGQGKTRWFVTEPGNVSSSFLDVLGISLLQVLVSAVFYIVRLLSSQTRFTISPENGSLANYHVATEPLECLDGRLKYYSRVTRWGEGFVETCPISYDEDIAKHLCKSMDQLVARFKHSDGAQLGSIASPGLPGEFTTLSYGSHNFELAGCGPCPDSSTCKKGDCWVLIPPMARFALDKLCGMDGRSGGLPKPGPSGACAELDALQPINGAMKVSSVISLISAALDERAKLEGVGGTDVSSQRYGVSDEVIVLYPAPAS